MSRTPTNDSSAGADTPTLRIPDLTHLSQRKETR